MGSGLQATSENGFPEPANRTMKQQDLTKLSKEELMERIKSQNAEDLKANTGCGTIFLIILVLNIFSFVGHNEIDWSNCIVPAFFVLWSMIEIWWKKRIDKCNGSEELVSMHKKYIKYRKTELIVALVLMVVLTYPLYLKYTATTVPVWLSIMVYGLWVALFCYFLWRLLKPKKSTTEQEIDRLQELIGN